MLYVSPAVSRIDLSYENAGFRSKFNVNILKWPYVGLVMELGFWGALFHFFFCCKFKFTFIKKLKSSHINHCLPLGVNLQFLMCVQRGCS